MALAEDLEQGQGAGGAGLRRVVEGDLVGRGHGFGLPVNGDRGAGPVADPRTMRRHTCQAVSGWFRLICMRASRLLTILTTLQAHGRVTATALAEECEVSVRTIYRDIDALSAA